MLLLIAEEPIPIPIAIVAELWLGGLFAFLAAPRIRADGVWSHPAALLPALYAGIILLPMTAYLYLAYPDWSWLYLFPADRVPRLAVIPVVAAGFAATLGGWAIVGRLVAANVDRRRLLGGLAGAGILVLVLLLVARPRLAHSGSHLDYHSGHALPLFDCKLGYVLTALAIAAAAAAGFIVAEIRRDARKASVR